MEYNKEIWNKYTDDNLNSVNPSSFIYHVTLALGAKSILEAGCNIGNNIKDFPNTFNVSGIDMNQYAINKAKERFPSFDFKVGSISDIPYADNSFDLVFTRTVLIHAPESIMTKAMDEIYRVSKKYIFSMEFYNPEEKMIEWKRGKDLLWYRNMKERWKKYHVKIISDVDIPIELDPDNVRFTLLEKL